MYRNCAAMKPSGLTGGLTPLLPTFPLSLIPPPSPLLLPPPPPSTNAKRQPLPPWTWLKTLRSSMERRGKTQSSHTSFQWLHRAGEANRDSLPLSALLDPYRSREGPVPCGKQRRNSFRGGGENAGIGAWMFLTCWGSQSSVRRAQTRQQSDDSGSLPTERIVSPTGTCLAKQNGPGGRLYRRPTTTQGELGKFAQPGQSTSVARRSNFPNPSRGSSWNQRCLPWSLRQECQLLTRVKVF